jgi:RNA polymerase subunit RPABC4/transcription elongation factor Spt4
LSIPAITVCSLCAEPQAAQVFSGQLVICDWEEDIGSRLLIAQNLLCALAVGAFREDDRSAVKRVQSRRAMSAAAGKQFAERYRPTAVAHSG